MDECGLYTLPTIVGAAFMVLAGLYGNGEERVERLEADGFQMIDITKGLQSFWLKSGF